MRMYPSSLRESARSTDSIGSVRNLSYRLETSVAGGKYSIDGGCASCSTSDVGPTVACKLHTMDAVFDAVFIASGLLCSRFIHYHIYALQQTLCYSTTRPFIQHAPTFTVAQGPDPSLAPKTHSTTPVV